MENVAMEHRPYCTSYCKHTPYSVLSYPLVLPQPLHLKMSCCFTTYWYSVLSANPVRGLFRGQVVDLFTASLVSFPFHVRSGSAAAETYI